MKILHIISQHPESTGSGFYLQNIVSQAAAAGHHNALVAGLSGDRFPPLAGIARESCRSVRFPNADCRFAIPGMSDVMPYRSCRFGDLDSAQLLAYGQAFEQEISQAVEKFQPDVIHSHHLWLVTALTRRLAPNLPLVTSCHSSELRQLAQCPHLAGAVLPFCRQIDRVLALSREQAATIASTYSIAAERIDLVGGGFNEKLFTLRREKPSAVVELVYAGKLSFAKGVDWLLRTCRGLVGQGIHLHLAGSGAGLEAQTCLDLAAELGAMVTVHGVLTPEELAALMGRCHICVLPSFYEGVPLVLLEALASGCRIITTSLPGCRELLAAASDDLVEFIELPGLADIDRPKAGDWPMLEDRLQQAIVRMVGLARGSGSPSGEEIGRITAQCSWARVFQRIERSYRLAGAPS